MEDRMYRICEEGFKDGDLEYFGSNIKQNELSGCFRLAVQWENYDVSDFIISKGYRVKNDFDVISDILYYVDREMIEKIEYLIESGGFRLDEKIMVMIVEDYYEYKYYHADNGFLVKIMGLYGRCCAWEKEG